MSRLAPTLWALLVLPFPITAAPGFLGAEVCAQCHKEIAARQRATNMARTWLGGGDGFHPGWNEATKEGESSYRVNRTAEGLFYELKSPRGEVMGRVESAVGGERHGISFLVRLKELNGVSLARPALVETRYLHSAKVKGLALSPGFPEERPTSMETAVGRVLSPTFEKKCLACHGSPVHGTTGRAGVECENCHGPGQAHVAAVAKGRPAEGVVNPKKLSHGQSVERCAECHAGFSDLVDPLPQDVLISNQATALRATECYIQTGGGLGCTSCHDPHDDPPHDSATYTKVCLNCHAREAKKAASCPVNPSEDCVRCHMPSVQRGPFTLVDHWIRVNQGTGEAHFEKVRSSIVPRRVFLRILSTPDRTQAEALRAQIEKGADFFELARQNSNDPSARAGGYLGEMRPDQMESTIAAAVTRLDHGEISPVLTRGSNYLLFQRMPRDFRWQAIAQEEEGNRLKAKGDLRGAINRYQQALKMNPLFARALVFLGVASGEAGDRARAIAVLEQAAYLFPKDPSAHYNLGISYGAAGRTRDEIAAYRRALELEPDLLPAWLNLGASLLNSGAVQEAVSAFEKGVEVNPLALNLYHNLALAYGAAGQTERAKWAERMAEAIGGRQ